MSEQTQATAPAIEAAPVAEQTSQPAQAQTVDPSLSAKPSIDKVDTATSVETNVTEKTAEQKPVVPEKYDLKMPEGALIDVSHLDEISSFAKEKGLSNEMAQSLLERESNAVKSYVDAQNERYREISDSKWIEQVKTDKELGGDKLTESISVAKRFVEKFATPEFKKVLEDTRYGNHPELIRMLYRAGKMMTDDKAVFANTQTSDKLSPEELFYGKGAK